MELRKVVLGCGHVEEHELKGNRRERDRYADRLRSERVCKACYRMQVKTEKLLPPKAPITASAPG